ncbi:hypothetical protein [Amorphus sp. MBR-141]
MALTFDSLSYARRLEGAGISRDHAEAHAEAARDFIMAELVTRQDLRDALDRQSLLLTVRLGAIMVTGIGALAALVALMTLGA